MVCEPYVVWLWFRSIEDAGCRRDRFSGVGWVEEDSVVVWDGGVEGRRKWYEKNHRA